VSPQDTSDNLLVPPQDTPGETNSKKVKQNIHAPTIYRVKGVVHLEGQSLIHILQGVHDVFDIQPSDVFRGSDPDKLRGENRFIFIGDNLSQEYLENILVNCIAD
jgi:G3E family GTPase